MSLKETSVRIFYWVLLNLLYIRRAKICRLIYQKDRK